MILLISKKTFSIFLYGIYILTQPSNISIDQKLSIQFQSLLIFLDLPNGIF
jgi:hypothetical protein